MQDCCISNISEFISSGEFGSRHSDINKQMQEHVRDWQHAEIVARHSAWWMQTKLTA